MDHTTPTRPQYRLFVGVDILGEAVMTQEESCYPELTARLIEQFLDSHP